LRWLKRLPVRLLQAFLDVAHEESSKGGIMANNSWRTELTGSAPSLIIGAEIDDASPGGSVAARAYSILNDGTAGGPIWGSARAESGVNVPFPIVQPHPFPVDPGKLLVSYDWWKFNNDVGWIVCARAPWERDRFKSSIVTDLWNFDRPWCGNGFYGVLAYGKVRYILDDKWVDGQAWSGYLRITGAALMEGAADVRAAENDAPERPPWLTEDDTVDMAKLKEVPVVGEDGKIIRGKELEFPPPLPTPEDEDIPHYPPRRIG
jgi:hypothetical protein